jgi:tRNA pseudouridine38-40 synthase
MSAPDPAERNIELLIEYNGARYCGWQRQDGQPTIQGELESAFKSVLETIPPLTAAGRTDTGVHALGQVVNFKASSNIEDWKFCRALNNFLPKDISVHRSREVSANFSARFDSVSKRYRYRVYEGPQPAALDHERAWWTRHPLNLEAMKEASEILVGIHDFNAFRSVHCGAESAVREMHAITFTRSPRPPLGDYLDIVFHANAFCRHMCRILAGSLVEVGLGKRTIEKLRDARDSRDRTQGGITAPPGGLTLLEVIYP